MYFHRAPLFYSLIISSLCNAMNESNHHLPLVSSFSTKEKFFNETVLIRAFSTEKDILGVGFPTNDTVLTIDDWGWSTCCSKTGEPKITIANKMHIDDFALSKDGKIAIVRDSGLTVHDIKTGDIIYKKIMYGSKRVAFCSNNNTLGVYNYIRGFNYTRGSITIHTIGTDEEEKYTTPPYVGQGLFTGNPTNKEFIINNKIVKYVTGDKNIITTYPDLPVIITDIKSHHYNPDGTVIVIQRQDGYLFHKRDNQVHKKDNQYFVINSSKNSSKSHKYAPYYSIALHPKKRFAALLTDDNSIEFWDYTKETEKPLAIIELPSKDDRTADWYNERNRLTAFAPDGEILAAATRNTFYIVPTPKAAYYDDATKAQCVIFNWVIKNHPDLPFIFIPQDIVKLITHKLSRIPDFQLPKPTAQ
jgi:WD40 repeat protein